MKRLSLFTLIAVLAGFMIPAASAQTQPFPDVYSSHVNVDAIDYLKDEGVIEGYPDGEYKPSININRAEFTKIIVGAVVDDPQGSNCFTDVQDQWFAKYVCQAEEMGIVDGYPDGSFKPAENINFSEASKIIANAYGKDAQDVTGERWFKEYVDALAEEKAIPFSVNFFDEKVTRDEMAEMIYRLKADVETKATRTYDEINADKFVTEDSCEAIVDRIHANETYYRYGLGGGMEVMEEAAMMDSEGDTGATPPADASAPGSLADGAANQSSESKAADDFSSTNVQVAGVDEADIVKNDGQYIYLIKNGTIRIVNAYPANEMEELVTLTLGDEGEDFWPSEMYVDGDTLVAIGSVWRSYEDEKVSGDTAEMSILPPYYYHNRTRVYVLDITDRTAPSVSRKVDFDGSYSTSRKVGDTLYTVMNQYAYYPYDFYENPDQFDPAAIIPHMIDSEEGVEELVAPCGDIKIFPKDQRNNFLITAAVPLTNTDAKVARNVLIGSAENVYASRNNMYVTATDWSGGWERDASQTTAVYRFALGINNIEYADRGNVPGHVLNQFSMDEYQNNFRIATTTDNFNEGTSNNMYVLNQNMDLVGSLENIAPGESIFSVRFAGDRAYMVTFLRVDPLFVIGLEDPSNPKILGELKIPGFSNYLHPYDENHLIGFGKEVDPGDSEIADDDFILWNQVQGLKVGLFDVSDVNNPQELYTEVIGDQGTDSPLLYNHKALLFDKEKELLAFPISVYEYQDESSCQDFTFSSCPNDCRQICEPSVCNFNNGILVCTADCDGPNSCVPQELRYGQKTFEGAYVYNLNLEDGFTLQGKINHHDEDDLMDLSETGWVDYQKAIERLVYIGENLYSISQWGIKANLLDDLSELNFIELAGNSDGGFFEPIPL